MTETMGKPLTRKDRRGERITQRHVRCENMGLPKYRLGEEIFSSVSHGVSGLFAIAALVLLLVFCKKDALTVTTTAVFGGMMVLLYTVSCIYHGLGLNKAKKVFRVLDHCVIFLLIAGTYTPITLVCIGGQTGILLFVTVWVAAALGVTLNAVNLERFKIFSMICYIMMGWVVIFALKPLLLSMSGVGVACLFAGGVAYTVGAVFYGFGKRAPYIHSVWHLFVLAGSALHCVSVATIVC